MALHSLKTKAVPMSEDCQDLDRDITGYLVFGKNETLLGKVADIIADSSSKVSRYMVSDTTIASLSVEEKMVLAPV